MGTQSTQPEAPAEAASDSPTGAPAQPHPTLPEAATELDRRGGRHRPGAGDGRRAEGRQRPPRHRDEPGARGLPALPEGDAARPGRPALARPRPLRALAAGTPASPSTSSSTSSGCGLELDDLEALRTWGSKTPGHPEYGHTAGRRDHHRPARPGRRQRRRHGDGRPPRARAVRPRRRRGRRACSTTTIYALRLRRRPRGGRQRRGVARSPAPSSSAT